MLTDLVLFRHGKAVRPHEASDDFHRALTERGHLEAATQAALLKAAGFSPDLALVSTALRAAQTWDEARQIYPDVPARVSRDYYLAAPDVYFDAASTSKASKVIVIAHDPGLHELACSLTKGDSSKRDEVRDLLRDLPTSGIAWFVQDATAKSGFRLNRYFSPKA